MYDTLSPMFGSIRITLSHEGIDEIFNGRNAISVDCYSYLMDCIVNTAGTLDPITDIIFYYYVGTVNSSTVIYDITKSRPTPKSSNFRATISNAIAPIKNIYEARLTTNTNIVYSTYSLPVITIPAGYTMSVDWTISYP